MGISRESVLLVSLLMVSGIGCGVNKGLQHDFDCGVVFKELVQFQAAFIVLHHYFYVEAAILAP